MTKLQQDIFNKHLKLVEPILKSYLLNHPLPSNEDIEDFKQKIYLRLLEICCNENFDSGRLTDGFIKQSTYYAIMSVYGNYNLASCRNDILNNASNIEDVCIKVSPDYDDIVIKTMLKDTLKEVLNTLTPREARVLELRFGLDGHKPKTQHEIAEMMGISRSYVSRIETKAINKLSKEFKD